MELDELKKNWQQSGESYKSRTQLDRMTQIQQHPKLKRIRFRLIFEAILLLAFVFTYNDILDGANKALWANIMLIGSALLFVLSDVIGYFTIQNPIKANNLKQSIKLFNKSLKKLSLFSVTSTFLFGASLILFMVSTIDLTLTKQLILAGMLVTLIALTYASYRNWNLRIKAIQATLKGLND